MKLVRFGVPGQENPGILDSKSQIRDLSQVISTLDDLLTVSRPAAETRINPHPHY
jgi:hypothetical protein